MPFPVYKASVINRIKSLFRTENWEKQGFINKAIIIAKYRVEFLRRKEFKLRLRVAKKCESEIGIIVIESAEQIIKLLNVPRAFKIPPGAADNVHGSFFQRIKQKPVIAGKIIQVYKNWKKQDQRLGRNYRIFSDIFMT